MAIHGKSVQPGTTTSSASVLVPGYGAFYGLEMDDLVSKAISLAGSLKDDISHSQTFAMDIKELSKAGQIMVGR